MKTRSGWIGGIACVLATIAVAYWPRAADAATAHEDHASRGRAIIHVDNARVSFETLVRISTDVVYARVMSARASKEPLGIPHMRYRLAILGSVKGFERSTLEVCVGGADMPDAHWVVPGAPEFTLGEEVVLFVWTDPVSGITGIVGLEQGTHRVTVDEAGVRRVDGAQAHGEELALFLARTNEAWASTVAENR